jgi:hypothetical protein
MPSGIYKRTKSPWNKGTKGIMPIPWNKGTKGVMKANPGSFKKGLTPWNKGIKGIHLSSKTEFKKGIHYSKKTEWKKGQWKGERHLQWKGENPSYIALHTWVARWLGKPKDCSFCGKKATGKQMHWANKNHKYKRNLKDWIRLCAKCHKKYDSELKRNNSI